MIQRNPRDRSWGRKSCRSCTAWGRSTATDAQRLLQAAHLRHHLPLEDRARLELTLTSSEALLEDRVRLVLDHYEAESKTLSYCPQGMVLCSSRDEVVRATRYARILAKSRNWSGSEVDSWTGVCGAFSFSVQVQGLGGVEDVDEKSLNGGHELRHAADARRVRILFVCQKFETGYDNPDLSFLYIFKQLKGRTVTQALMRW